MDSPLQSAESNSPTRRYRHPCFWRCTCFYFLRQQQQLIDLPELELPVVPAQKSKKIEPNSYPYLSKIREAVFIFFFPQVRWSFCCPGKERKMADDEVRASAAPPALSDLWKDWGILWDDEFDYFVSYILYEINRCWTPSMNACGTLRERCSVRFACLYVKTQSPSRAVTSTANIVSINIVNRLAQEMTTVQCAKWSSRGAKPSGMKSSSA